VSAVQQARECQSEQPPMPSETGPLIHILMATFNGAAYLREQLESIAAQRHVNWTLWISDDGSTDGTLAICEAFAKQHHTHRIRLLKGPARGPTANFFHLLLSVQGEDPSALFAFADQDDVWLPEKLDRATTALNDLGSAPQQPALYGALTRLVDDRLKPTGVSERPLQPLGFGNALLQNVVSGNTMVFNFPLLERLRHIQPEHAVWHDWSAYQTVTGCGGSIHFDTKPCLLYRQHDGNLVGSQGRSWDKVLRLGMLFRGQYRTWGDKTEAAMADLAPFLDPQARDTLQVFQQMRRHVNPLERLRLARSGHLWRQTSAGRASLWLGLLLNQI
jgi:glycosyltransferase involved in cell wall biosynthesis